jgi:hypothetical protein
MERMRLTAQARDGSLEKTVHEGEEEAHATIALATVRSVKHTRRGKIRHANPCVCASTGTNDVMTHSSTHERRWIARPNEGNRQELRHWWRWRVAGRPILELPMTT